MTRDIGDEVTNLVSLVLVVASGPFPFLHPYASTGLSAGDLLTLLLGGGAVATIGALFKGLQALQSGSRSRERDTVTELIKQRKEAWDDRDGSNNKLDYWRNRAGTSEFLARQAGVQLPDYPEPPV